MKIITYYGIKDKSKLPTDISEYTDLTDLYLDGSYIKLLKNDSKYIIEVDKIDYKPRVGTTDSVSFMVTNMATRFVKYLYDINSEIIIVKDSATYGLSFYSAMIYEKEKLIKGVR